MVLLFPDTTVLVNFAIADRMDLLRQLANGNGRWVASVADECRRSARIPGLSALTAAKEIFGGPLIPEAAELVDARTLRDQLARPGDEPAAHLGEAETLAIITRRPLMAASAVFATDDRDALALAYSEGVKVVDTWDLLGLAVRVGRLSAGGFARIDATLVGEGRRRPRRR